MAEAIGRLTTSRVYPSACLVEPYRKRVATVLAALPSAWPQGILSDDFQDHLCLLKQFHSNHAEIRDEAVQRFIANELEASRDLFDTIEANPLSPEQRTAVVTDEDATLVLAAAGSGKTSVIVAKVAHILQQDPKAAENILLLAFAKKAANEMSNRIRDKCGVMVQARTFHSLGLSIIRQVEGRNPSLSSWATDDVQRQRIIREMLEKHVMADQNASQYLMRWFHGEFLPTTSLLDLWTARQYQDHLKNVELRTLKGEKVRSYEEVLIANWLYTNGIEYEYEAPYRGPLPDDTEGRSYHPDFYLTDLDVYLEHFGVGRERAEDGSWRLYAAPFMDEDRYLKEMAWKRELHATNGTRLLETYSYQKKEGTLLKGLHEQLSEYISLLPQEFDLMLMHMRDKHRVDQFTKLMDSFLSAFRASPLTLEQVRDATVPEDSQEMVSAFLCIFEIVCREYEARLDGGIDFNDMIARAISYVETNRYISQFKHIIVDEYQDISDSRTMLLQALKSQVPSARIFAVGDDWQSIFRFAGSNINAMRDFDRNFGGRLGTTDGICQTIDLGRTFRSVDKISSAARRFILQNDAQIEKTVDAVRTAPGTAIWHTPHENGEQHDALHQVLTHIGATHPAGTSVLLLGRGRTSEPNGFSELAHEFENLSLRFMTVHASKGLEADVVIVLDMNRGYFPMTERDTVFMNLVLPKSDQFHHADERRLFYVALTRAKQAVFLIYSAAIPSPFVEELKEDPAYGVAKFHVGTTKQDSQSGHDDRRNGGATLPSFLQPKETKTPISHE